MRISNKSWADYAKAMSAINKKASEKMKAWIESNGIDDFETMIQYAYALVTKYGEASSALACEMYDIVAERDSANLPAAEPAPTATYNETAKAVNGAALRGVGMIPGAVDRLTKQAGQDTTLINAIRDGAEFAWIPSGDTCAFCITLASNGWQLASKKTLRGDHAEHIHANCDCAFAIRHGADGDVAGYDPEKYRQMYYDADGLKPNDKINSMRRANYAKNKEFINEQKRNSYHIAQMLRRKTSVEGYEIIDKATYGKLTKEFKKNKGIIIRGEDADLHLKQLNATAAYLPSLNTAFIKDEPTVSDVLEEMYHAKQDRRQQYGEVVTEEVLLRREIDAQKYLMSVKDKYKIPIEEQQQTLENLSYYEEQLKALLDSYEE